MSLTDKETHQKDEVLFSGSMRHRKLPRARRRKKRTPEITVRPVGAIDPLTGEITVADEVDDLSEKGFSVPEEIINPRTENISYRKDVIDSLPDDNTVQKDVINSMPDDNTEQKDVINSMPEDMIIPDDMQDNYLSDDLLWTDLDDTGTDEDNESDSETRASDFSAETSSDDMFLADIEEEDTGSKDEDEQDGEAQDDEESSGRFSLSNIFRKTRTDKKKRKKSQSRGKKAHSKGLKSSSEEGTAIEDEDYDDDLADDENEDPDYNDSEENESDTENGDSEETEEPEVVHNPVIRYDPDLTYGLTSEEVSDREAEGLINVTVRKGQKTVRQIVLSHTLTYFNLLNILLGILVATTGQWKNMLFLGIIIGNSAIGIFQELKVKSLIDNLTVITAARVTAIRDGSEEDMPVDNIVVDDVIKLGPGDQVVTDGRVFDCRGLEVNESMLTGESRAVKKRDGDQVLSGSFILAGTALQRVDKVGNDSYASQLVAKASHKKRASSEMQRTIGRIIKVVSVIIIPVGLLLYRSQMIANGGVFANAIIRTVSGIIGMIPEGLVLLTSVSFIIGVGRLANKKALVQEMPSIESLARANIICTDKTGTITTGELRVNEVLPMGRVTRDQVMDIMAHINSAFTDTNVTQDALNAAFGKIGRAHV